MDTCICTAESLLCYLKLSQHCYKIKVKKNKIKFESIKNSSCKQFEVYKTVFFTIITVLYISSPELTFYSIYLYLQVCALEQHHSNSPFPKLLATNHSNFYFHKFGFLRFHINMTSCSVYLFLTDLSQFNGLKVQLCYHKWQDFLLFRGHIVFHCVCVCVCCLVMKSCPAVLRSHGLQPVRLFVHGISQARILEWYVCTTFYKIHSYIDSTSFPYLGYFDNAE